MGAHETCGLQALAMYSCRKHFPNSRRLAIGKVALATPTYPQLEKLAREGLKGACGCVFFFPELAHMLNRH